MKKTIEEKIQLRRKMFKMRSLERSDAYTYGGMYAENHPEMTRREFWETANIVAKTKSEMLNNTDFEKTQDYVKSMYAGFLAERSRQKKKS